MRAKSFVLAEALLHPLLRSRLSVAADRITWQQTAANPMHLSIHAHAGIGTTVQGCRPSGFRPGTTKPQSSRFPTEAQWSWEGVTRSAGFQQRMQPSEQNP